MKANHAHQVLAGIAAGFAVIAASNGQTIGIRVDGNVHLDVDTPPAEQFWVTESPDLVNWTQHTFVDHPASVDCGPPGSAKHFYSLEPLYGSITWTQLPDMPVARDQFTGGVINGKLYVFGGNGDPDGVNLSRLDIYDLETGAWTQGTDYAFGIEELSGAVVGGKLYVFGGYAGHRIRVSLCYDPETDSWTELPARPTEAQAGKVVVWGQEILALGGMFLDEENPEGRTSAVEAYDTVGNSWRFVTDVPYDMDHCGFAICNDVLYLVGGLDGRSMRHLNVICRFDLKAESWLPEIEGVLPHPIFVPFSSACPVVNGKMVMAGGLTSEHGGFTEWIYDLHLVSVEDASDIPDSGAQLVVIARILTDDTLRFRAFDSLGQIALDKAESDFPEHSAEIESLRQQLASLWEQETLTADQKRAIFDVVVSITGQTPVLLSDLVTVYDIEENTFSHNTSLPQSVTEHLFLLGEDQLLLLGGQIAPYETDTLTATMFSGAFGN